MIFIVGGEEKQYLVEPYIKTNLVIPVKISRELKK